MKLLISLLISVLLISCELSNNQKLFDKNISKNQVDKKLLLKYVTGEPYLIQGVKYTPKENYKYNQVGLASFYGKELHNIKTINNDFNKVTELLGRHKTLPIPSIVKVTNLDNGLSLTIKINDRHNDNSSLIQVSRKSAQLLKFYKNKIAKVRVEILVDPSKQWKRVVESINQDNFNDTILSAPTESVIISNIDDKKNTINQNLIKDSPIEIGFENIKDSSLFLKIFNFESYDSAKLIISELELSYKFTVVNESNSYSLIIGPLKNKEADNLVLSFIAKGYKKTEFLIE